MFYQVLFILIRQVLLSVRTILHHLFCLPRDDLFDQLNGKLRATIDAIAPVKLKRATSKRRGPWMSEETSKFNKKCRTAEQKCRKSKLQVHYDILREQLGIYNKAIRNARRAHFSNLITNNQNNLRVLFSTIDGLINPTHANLCELSSTSKCDEFAAYFRDKITNIRLGISQAKPDERFDMCLSLPRKGTMDFPWLTQIKSNQMYLYSPSYIS